MASAFTVKSCGPSPLQLLRAGRCWTTASDRTAKSCRRVRYRTPLTRRLSAMTEGVKHNDATEWQQQAPYQSAEAGFDAKYTARCMCGEVQYAVDCDPVAAKYCHCTSCQQLHGELMLGSVGKCVWLIECCSAAKNPNNVCITGAPFQWAALFHKKSLRFLKGVDKLMFFYSQDKEPVHKLPCKVACSKCHSPIADEGRNMWMSFPTLFKFDNKQIPEAFKPSCHIFYQQRVIDVKDGKPKWSKHQDQSELVSEA